MCDAVARQSTCLAADRLTDWIRLLPAFAALCLKKIPTLKLSITLSSLNQFSKFLHCWKVYEICYKAYTTLPTSP